MNKELMEALDILEKEKEISKQEYEKYIKKHSCNLVGDKNEFTKNF